MTPHDKTVAQIAAWWGAHPDFRESFKKHGNVTAARLALSVVHWHHNYEGSLRHNVKDGNGGPMADNDAFFCRRYAILATQAWLIESQVELETYPADHAHWNGYGHRDQETLICDLQMALDDFEYNDHQSESHVKP